MKLPLSISYISNKLIVLLSIIFFSVFTVYALMTRQSYLIIIWFTALVLSLLLSQRNASVFRISFKLLLLSAIIFFAIQFGTAIIFMKNYQVAIVLVALLIPVLFTQPKLITYFYLSIILLFPTTGWGTFKLDYFNIYTKGGGFFHFSFVNILLWLIVFSITIQKIIKKSEDESGPVYCSLYRYFWLFNILFVLYILWGFGIGVHFFDITAYNGVINITNMTIFVFVMLQIFKTEKDIEQLKVFFLACMVIRGMWGVYRFFFLGGDPANPYAHYEGLRVKISIFDVGDGFIACVAIFYVLWVMFHSVEELSTEKRFFYWLIIVIGVFNIFFSYRRTAWIGLLLAGIWLTMSLPLKKRLAFAVITAIISTAFLSVVMVKRFGAPEVGGFLQYILPDLYKGEGQITVMEGRFLELKMAWETIKKGYLFFGIGPWGSYENINPDKWRVTTELVHSALMHMFLKMGLIGLIVFISFFYEYIIFWVKKRKELPVEVRGVAEASFAGFLFFIPHILFGTPIIELRHMMLFGFFFAVPYIVYHIYHVQKIEDMSQN